MICELGCGGSADEKQYHLVPAGYSGPSVLDLSHLAVQALERGDPAPGQCCGPSSRSTAASILRRPFRRGSSAIGSLRLRSLTRGRGLLLV